MNQSEIRKNQIQFHNETFAELVNQNFLGALFNGTNFNEIEENLQSFKMLHEEPFQRSTMNFFTSSRGYLAEILEKFILEAQQHGILDYFHRRVYRFEKVKENIESETQVLSMYMLSAGFYVWLVTVALACFVFIGEHIFFFIKEKITARILENFVWMD